jgi:FtsH ternary system-associated peptide
MCNPRRVRVRATRQLAQSWEQEVRRTVTRSGAAVAEARVREPLAATIGAPALAALEAVLSSAPGWEHDESDDTYRHPLDGGMVIYHAATRELEIVATASEDVEVSADAVTRVAGNLGGTVEAEGVGTYYDDNWGGLTHETAERAAHEAAERALDAAVREREAQQRADAEEHEGDAVAALAAERAEAALAAARAERADALRAVAAARLTAIGIQGRNLFHQVLAQGYGNAILAYARSRRAEGITRTERDGIVSIEFELQV